MTTRTRELVVGKAVCGKSGNGTSIAAPVGAASTVKGSQGWLLTEL